MSPEETTYLDSSAIVKLVVRERETAALSEHISRRTTLVSSAIAVTEVLRAVMDHGDAAGRTAVALLQRLELLRISDRILIDAGRLQPAGLRSLDAIHLASALAFGDSLQQMICYDLRLTEASRAAGLSVDSPGW